MYEVNFILAVNRIIALFLLQFVECDRTFMNTAGLLQLHQVTPRLLDHPARRLRGGEGSTFDAAGFLASYGIRSNLSHLEVTYHADTGAVHLQEDIVMEFDSSDWWLQRQPRVSWEGKKTLLMLDPDAPQPNHNFSLAGRLGPWLHWLVVDAEDEPEKGRCLVEYMGPAPPSGTW